MGVAVGPRSKSRWDVVPKSRSNIRPAFEFKLDSTRDSMFSSLGSIRPQTSRFTIRHLYVKLASGLWPNPGTREICSKNPARIRNLFIEFDSNFASPRTPIEVRHEARRHTSRFVDRHVYVKSAFRLWPNPATRDLFGESEFPERVKLHIRVGEPFVCIAQSRVAQASSRTAV